MENEKNTKMKFHVLAILAIILFCFAISPITLQNDTYYTIKIGEHILENGVDMQDPFSWHSDLPYTYPHWAYDVGMYLLYHVGGFTAIYISTIVLACTLGIVIYLTNHSITKNQLTSFFITLGVMYVLKDFIAARAQLVTFTLFVLTIFCIEKFLKTKKKRYGIGLILISIAIANLHCAVWPFYFVLYLPYIAEYFLCCFFDSNIGYRIRKSILKYRIKQLTKKQGKEKKIEELTARVDALQNAMDAAIVNRQHAREYPYRLKIEKNAMVKWLIVIMVICAFTGFLTPIGDTPYTYLINTMEGNTTKSISEHLPMTLINNKNMLISLALFLGILIFTDTKIKLRDFFMLGGLVYLSLMSRRQISIFVLVGGIILNKLCVSILDKYDKEGSGKLIKAMTSWAGKIITIGVVVIIAISMYKPKVNDEYVNSNSYPVEAAKFIKENIDLDNMRLFNEYNYGSYLLYEGIPVFIDSRADLYAPEFNKAKGEDGRDIFSDYINTSNISNYYEDTMEKYQITHVILQRNAKLNMFISRDENYKQIYWDSHFVIYERLNVEV